MCALHSTSHKWNLVLLLCSCTIPRTWLLFPLYLGIGYGVLKGTLVHGGIRFWSEEGWAGMRRLGLPWSLAILVLFLVHVQCCFCLRNAFRFLMSMCSLLLGPLSSLTINLGDCRSWDRLGRVTPGTENLVFSFYEWNQLFKEWVEENDFSSSESI